MNEWSEYLFQIGKEIGDRTIEFLPKFLAAVIIVAAGLLIAKILQKLVQKLCKVVRLDKYAKDSGGTSLLESVGVQVSIERIISVLVFWTVLFAFFLPASNVLGFTFFSRIINGIISYLPNIAVALLILLLGIWGARAVGALVGGVLTRMDSEYAESLQTLVKALVVFSAVVIALLQLRIAVQLLSNMLLLFVGALVVGFAAVFVLGVKDVLRYIVISEYLRKALPTGVQIKTDYCEGTVVEIGPLTTTIQQKDGSEVAIRNTDLLERQGVQ